MLTIILISLIITIDLIEFSVIKVASKADDYMLGDKQYE